MTRRFAWVLNLDVELELLRGKRGYVAPRKLTEQLASHGQSARRLLGPSDVLVEQAGSLSASDRQGLRGRAWCPSPIALEQMRSAGIEPEPHPSAEVLRRVNHRAFAHQLGGGLPEQHYVHSARELSALLASHERRWLLKRPLTFAGRGQLRTLGPLTQKQEEWITASFTHDGLLVEPLVEPKLELSLHGFVWPEGKCELGRVCVQQVSERGHFRGIRLAQPGELDDHETAALLERGQAAATALHRASYFGPLGIDGYRYTLDGQTGFCALGELNARYTLGFVTGFPRHPSELCL
jgi:hypothetical protein